jgi:hypothetical protein
MKKQLKFLTLSFCFLALSITTTAQTTRRVNGDPNITGVNVYNTIQAAVDAANTDDVILIEPWGGDPYAITAPYPDAVGITKKVHLRGNGYKLKDLIFPPNDKHSVQIGGTITFDTRSAGSSMKFLNNEPGVLNIYDENITVESCLLYIVTIGIRHNGNILESKGSGVKMKKVLNRSSTIQIDLPNISTTDPTDSYNSGLEVMNCYLTGILEPGFRQYKAKGVTVINSTIESQLRVQNSTVVNVIFLGQFDPNINVGTSVSHCISTSNGLPSLSNNTNSVLLNDIWIDAGQGYSFENKRFLKSNSIAKGYGINGEDIGEYGGSDPYQLSGLPHSPIANDLQNTQVGNKNINIQVQASYQAN